MCGIFCIMDSTGILNNEFIYKQFQKGKCRGPHNSQKLELGFGIKLGFHNGNNKINNNNIHNINMQPIIINNIALVCNGNILNYKELFNELNIKQITDYNCEIIIHLYNLYGIERTLELLDGDFTFILYDMKIIDVESSKIFIGRDPFGIKPLYILRFENLYANEYIYAFASELKVLSSIYNYLNEYLNNFNKNLISKPELSLNLIKNNFSLTLKPFNIGTYSLFEKQYTILAPWKETIINKAFFSFISSFPNNYYFNNKKEAFNWITKGIQENLYQAVKKRYLNYYENNKNLHLPIGCLLSGGVDSCIITYLVHLIHEEENKFNKNKVIPLETYSIGIENSDDLKYAKSLSQLLKTNHHEIIVSEKEIIDSIPEVIKIVESYDLNTIRYGIIWYLLGKYIKEKSKSKFIFGGNGADEVCGGFNYTNSDSEMNCLQFDEVCRKLIRDSSLFNLMGIEKCFAISGLDISCPFLDKNFVNFYLSIPTNIRFNKQIEKFLIRDSFSKLNKTSNIIYNEILWRKKTNFNRGFWTKKNSLSKIIEENLNSIYNTYNKYDTQTNNKLNSEKKYYKNIFDIFFPLIDSNYIDPYLFYDNIMSIPLSISTDNKNGNVNDFLLENELENNYIVI